MLELDEYNQILVASQFVVDSSTVSSANDHDTLAPTLDSSPEHPLRSRSVSPARHCDTPSIPSVIVIGSEGETRHRPTGLPGTDGLSTGVVAEQDDSDVSRGGTDIIMHPVGPNDSFAGVALRYGVSIAALRRANQLWPSDPIHLRTELLIPCGDSLRAKRRPIHRANTDPTLQSTSEPTSSLSPDLFASSFVSARNMISSVLSARISMESLSSKTSVSEDHEMDDLQRPRSHETSVTGGEEGHELSALAVPHAQYRWPSVPVSSQVTYSSSNTYLGHDHIPPAGDPHLQCISSSPTASIEQLSRLQPFAILPVRTSQLEPEPAMELHLRRRPRI